MILEDARNYTFMTKGAVRVPGIEDVEEFQMTQNAMKVMGISDEDMSSIWRVISASLLFGNMEFKQERNSDQATLPDNTVAQKVSLELPNIRQFFSDKLFLNVFSRLLTCWVSKWQTWPRHSWNRGSRLEGTMWLKPRQKSKWSLP